MRLAAAAIVVAVAIPVPLRAQEAVPGWPGLEATRLPLVYVLDDGGAETAGRLLRISPESLTILSGGAERQFEAARVRRIQARGDSLRNGALIGLIVGGVLGAVSAGISDCPGSEQDGCPGSRVAILLFSTGVYTAVGTGIDALVQGRRTLYVAPATAAARTSGSRFPPSNTPQGALTLTLRW